MSGDGTEWRLREIRDELRDISWRLVKMEMWIFISLIVGVSIGIALGMYFADTAVDHTAEAYTEGYRQGVMDALGDPDQALASILCTGDYNATVTIDGMEFTLTCQR